ncbi:phage tail protein [Enterobacter cloacae]|uniref:phage tail protein n=1 Tax=Enterobacter cloacae TaxID=550 RepID=UPI00345D4F84
MMLHFKTMMTLGTFQFSVDEAAYQSFQRTLSWRWGEQVRFGQMESLQYVGQSVPVITFFGRGLHR